MSHLIALTFDYREDASRAHDSLLRMQRDGNLDVYDTAVITKDASGEVHIHNDVGRDVKVGAGVGGIMGLIASAIFPLAGLAVGAAGGALVGKLLDRHVDKRFVQQVSAALEPGSSALCALVGDHDPDALGAALEPHQGHIYQTTLSSEFDQELRDAMRA